MRICDWSSDVCSSDLFGFSLLLMLVSGLVIYPEFWRGLFRLRLRQGSAVLLHDLHRLVAGCAVWFLAVIALTASWYLAERLLADTGATGRASCRDTGCRNE